MKLLNAGAFLLICFSLFACGKKKLFETISPSHSGIHFNNEIIENDSINELDIENVYNGGGVGIGDFNNDGLQDIYFTGNLVPNKLYLNKGGFEFRDITTEANVEGKGRWCRGVAVVDINNDGRQDLYVTATLNNVPALRENLLYVNQGLNTDKIPVFKEMAAEYGLNDTTHSTHAAFFDFDNDGDLDVYIVANVINKYVFPDNFHPTLKDGSNPSTGKLYRNDWSDSLQHGYFVDVSRNAGIQTEGYGHSVNICDINKDGWKDIYVTNDFISNDLLWINNQNGTFSEKLSQYFKHTSANSMGTDIVDINNDGLSDVVVLDMNPEDNYRKKMMLNPVGYSKYQNSDLYGYNYQYVRNTLQLNQGPRVGQQDTIGDPVFSEIGFFADIAETDWSWTPLVTDFDNDGYRDIIVTNGFPKDITDHDFTVFRQEAYQIASKQQLLSQIPVVKLHNYGFRNNGDLTFSDASVQWGLEVPSFSNGAAYADFDNDGDLDFVINNINDKALLYRNTQREKDKENSHYIQVKFEGAKPNIGGIGADVEIFYGKGKKQVWENTPYRGYLSTMQDIAHFGLGKETVLDSVKITWPDKKVQLLKNVKPDQLLVVRQADARTIPTTTSLLAGNALFREVTTAAGVNYQHPERDYIDFNIQKLLPHKLSEYGPGLAVGDVDGNGLDDIICGGSYEYSAQLFLQQPGNTFKQSSLLKTAEMPRKLNDDMGVLLFDADQDSDLDLFISSGGFESKTNSANYRDRFYVNDGKGNFLQDSVAMPENLASKSCARAFDYDKDGDLDLFVAGRVNPWNYPKPVSSFIYRNDSKTGQVKFTDVTAIIAKDLNNIGLTCDVLCTDFNNDGWIDIILTGEWMPVTFLKNEKGVFRNITLETGIANATGWWNSISAGDFDSDGDMDYIVGNQGQNSYYKASDKYPVSIYAKDFDNNESFDAFPSLYIPTSQQDTQRREFPAHGRDDAVKQMISMRTKFQNYKSFAQSTMDQVFTKEQLTGALILKATNLKSAYMRNDGNNKFTLVPLITEAQLSVINGMIVEDFDGDGQLDVLVNGNDYGTDVTVGRYDALNGLLMKGDGKGGFAAMSILQSGIYIPGNGKAIVKLRSGSNQYMVAASQNRGPLKIFELKNKVNCVPLQRNDEFAKIEYQGGKIRKEEFYHGSSFLSQSSRFVVATDQVKAISVTDNKGQSRTINFKSQQ